MRIADNHGSYRRPCFPSFRRGFDTLLPLILLWFQSCPGAIDRPLEVASPPPAEHIKRQHTYDDLAAAHATGASGLLAA
jgi:hypothetical protein